MKRSLSKDDLQISENFKSIKRILKNDNISSLIKSQNIAKKKILSIK